jgi:hypothetical protein
MAYSAFSLTKAQDQLGLEFRTTDLFPGVPAVPPPGWLIEGLARGRELTISSEKARNEFLVAPVLLAAREVTGKAFVIYSGTTFDVDVDRGLNGECDFILAAQDPLPIVQAPILTMVEAKKADIDDGLGQCVAQTVAAAVFNDRRGRGGRPAFGCVTTGDAWQFLRLDGAVVTFDRIRRELSDLPGLLGVFSQIVRATAG